MKISSQATEMNDIEALEKLERDEDFQELSRILKSQPPNIFRVLGITHNEVRWSAFLAWLLDPGGSHGLGSMFLRDLLVDVLRKSEREYLHPIDVYSMDLSDAEVRTEECFGEKGRGDITIRCLPDRLLCIIENKIWSGEHLGQTEAYYDAGEVIAKREQFDIKIRIFLSPKGMTPGCKGFIPYSYAELVRILEIALDKATAISSERRHLIEAFILTVREELGVEQSPDEVRRLSQSICNRYREAVELLMRNVRIPELQAFFEALFGNIKKSQPDFYPCFESNSLTLSPVDWQNNDGRFSDVCYVFVAGPDNRIVLRLWAEKDWKINKEELRTKVKELAEKRACAHLVNESEDYRLVQENTDIEVPKNFTDWSEEVGQLTQVFVKFLERFPVADIEKVPGVKRL